MIAFFTKADPKPEVSLAVATSFFPESIRKEAMTEYKKPYDSGNPLENLNYTSVTPYLVSLK